MLDQADTVPAGLDDAFTKFCQSLTFTFSQEPDAPPTPENERERMAAALTFVAELVGVFDKSLAHRFYELGSALADLNAGAVRPILRPVDTDTRPPDPSDLWRARACAALAAEALKREGLRAHEVEAILVQPQFSELRRLVGKKGQGLPGLIEHWRRELKSRRQKNFEAAAIFSEGCKIIDELGHDPTRLRKFALDMLSRAAAPCVFSP